MQIKICGIRSERDCFTTLRSGADALGFIVGTMFRTEDGISPQLARHLIARLPEHIAAVLVTHLSDPDDIVTLFRQIQPTIIQLHGEMAVDQLRNLKVKLPGMPMTKVIHIGPQTNTGYALAKARAFAPYTDAFLLDTRTDDRIGGTGITHDWAISQVLVEQLARPVILAGGLNPENVREAIQLVGPSWVDVNSGVEDQYGNKSFEKCLAFVQRAKN